MIFDVLSGAIFSLKEDYYCYYWFWSQFVSFMPLNYI